MSVGAGHYEIRTAGSLPSDILDGLTGLSVSPARVETVIRGYLPDQASLFKFLERLELVGSRVLEIRRMRHDPLPPVPGETQAEPGRLG